MSNEGDVSGKVKKKHKKRKNSEISDLGGDKSNVQLADERRPNKKLKMKVWGDTSKEVPGVDFGSDMDKSHKKKKKKDVNGIDVDTLWDNNKSKENMKKGISGDRGGVSKELEPSGQAVNEYLEVSKSKRSTKEKNDRDGIDHKENNVMKSDVGVASDNELLKGGEVHSREKGHANKKKKNRTEFKLKKKSNINGGDASLVKKQVNHEVIVNKKQENVKEDLGDRYLSEENLGNSHGNAAKSGEDNQVESNSSNEQVIRKKKRKNSKKCKDAESTSASEIMNAKGSIDHTDSIVNQSGNEVNENVLSVKDKKRKKKKKKKNASEAVILDKEFQKNTHGASIDDSEKSRDKGSKKRKEKSRGCYTKGDANNYTSERNKTAEPSELSNHNKKSKKVQFSDTVEVFPLADVLNEEKKKTAEDGSEEKNNVESGLVQGKRFSKEEDDFIRNAVYKYIEDHQLGEEGVEMIMNCKSHRGLKGCWKEIGKSLPWRPYIAVYTRAHILFERSEDREWTPEEVELVKKFHEKHGPDWKTLADELGKHRIHVKDLWRRNRYPNTKRGNWSQEEYQNLFNLVNMDLSMKALTEKRSKHGMLKDNISWEAVSDQLATRNNSVCCIKWYRSLTSPMVAEGKWANADDYRMLIALVDRDDACEDDVDWDNLLEHRDGDICRKRWNQMVRHIGEHGKKSFIEQVEILSQRYCPDILDARESYDNRPPVD